MWWFVLGSPWVASLELESKPLYLSIHTHLSSLIRQLYPDSRVKELPLHIFRFEHSQPLVLFPVAHSGLGSFSTVTLTYCTPAQGRAWCL